MTLPALPARSSLTQQLARAAAALAAVAVLLVGAGSWWWTDRLQHDAHRQLVEKDLALSATQVATTLAAIEERIVQLADSPLLTTALTDSLGREGYLLPYLGSVQVIHAIPVELMLTDFAGEELGRNGDLSFTPPQREWMRAQLRLGSHAARVDRTGAGRELLLAVPVRYPRTRTVEGGLLLKLSLDLLLADRQFRLVQADEPVPADHGLAEVAPLGRFDALRLAVVGPAAGPPMASRGALAATLALVTLALVASVLWVGVHLGRRLTADLRALDDFARGVAAHAFGDERAPTAGAAEVAGLAQSINRMLDRLNAQHAQMQGAAEAQLRLLATCIERLNDVVMITEAWPDADEGHRIVFVNDAFVRLTGYTRDEVIGRSPRFLQGPRTDRAELDRVKQSLARWQPVTAEVLNYTKDGREVWIEMAIVPVTDAHGEVTHWVSVERDTTARREADAMRQHLQDQVREAQKMEAIGTLAGGIAHDFNNILGAILGNVTLAEQDLAEGRAVRARLEQISRSAGRARSLVEQILTFSRRQAQAQPTPQALGPLVDETVALLRATAPARVRIESTQPEEPLHAMGDATALSQVLMNLGTNAWQALGGSSGRVHIGLEAVELPAANPALRLPAGPHVHLWVSDDGCGMDAATQARIFEPFFTTKPVGAGTGLGLSVVLGIVQTHHGAITVDSRPGAGTTFHVWLPRVAAPPPQAAPAAAKAPAARGRGQHVLYIDDDEVMLSLAEALLQGWGYRVSGHRDAAAALAALREAPQAVDLVVTDFNMPELSGLDVLRAVRSIRPDLPVLLASGYLADELRDEALRAGASGLLRKQHLQDDLAEQLAEALPA